MVQAQALTLSDDFRQTTLSLRDLLDQLHQDISAINFSTAEAFQDLKQNLLHSVKNWSETIDDYKESIREMPKALRQRSFIKQSIKDIEAFEKDMQRFLSEIKDYSFQQFCESFNQHLRTADDYLKSLQVQARQMAQQVAELEQHALVQKFLRGETILSSKKHVQWPRKFTHVSLGLLSLYLFVYSGWSWTLIWTIAGGFILWSFSLETMRHFNPRVNRWVCHHFRPIMREAEKTRVNSAIFYIFSIGFIYFTFPIEVTMLTLLMLAVADPIAGIVGVYWGRRQISPHVSLEGALGCFVACAGLAALCAGLLFQTHLSGLSLFLFSILSGLVGAVAEGSFKKLDDNLIMPLISAPFLWILMKVFSIL